MRKQVFVYLDLSDNKTNCKNMDLINEALEFEKSKMSNMSTSDRVAASREAKRLILALNEVYKKSKDTNIMDVMKCLTVKKKKIEIRLKGKPEAAF